MLSGEFMQALEKRALGFSYEETVLEYEKDEKARWYYCEKYNRLNSVRGYIKIQKTNETNNAKALNFKKIKNFFIPLNARILKGRRWVLVN